MAALQNQQAKSFWSDHVKQWKSSGLSQAAYCRQYDLCEQKFSYRKRQSISDKGHSATSSCFTRVQVDVNSPATSNGLALRFNDGVRIEGITESNLVLVQSLLAVLR